MSSSASDFFQNALPVEKPEARTRAISPALQFLRNPVPTRRRWRLADGGALRNRGMPVRQEILGTAARAQWSFGGLSASGFSRDRKGDGVIEDLNQAEVEALDRGGCPDCKHSQFIEGPHGGMNVNIMCGNCGAKFNVVPGLAGSFGKQRIGRPTFAISTDGNSITCRVCGKTSYNENDVGNRWCGHCQAYHLDFSRTK